MSSAHRPTWSPAIGKAGKEGSKIISARDMAGHTRLKFRQPGQTSATDLSRRDLKAELLAAEREAAERKAKGESGLPPPAHTLLLSNGSSTPEGTEDEVVAAKRRRVLVDLGGVDADDDDEVEDGAGDEGAKGKGRAESVGKESDEEEEESDDDDDEDETAELLRELEKIKRERAEERERVEREKAATEQTSREEEIATGNPLLNLQSALGYSPTPSTLSSPSTTSTGFGVKRRWDDDVIFKNQARGTTETPRKEFVNDLLRTEFHKRFMKRFIA